MLFVWLFLYGAIMLLSAVAVPVFPCAQLAGLCLYTLALTVWIFAAGKSEAFGLRKVRAVKQHLFFIPWLMPVFYHLFRFGFSVPEWKALLGILCAGVLEELLFRGILLHKLRLRMLGIFLSTLAFGAAHFLNLENGTELVPVIYQVCFALCVGFSLSGLRLSCGSILPGIAIHCLINITAPEAAVEGDPLFWLCALICALCGVYSIWIWKEGEKARVTA